MGWLKSINCDKMWQIIDHDCQLNLLIINQLIHLTLDKWPNNREQWFEVQFVN